MECNAGAADLFTSYAAEIGLDADSFAACLENHEFETAVQADMAEAAALGLSGTPAFLINGQQMFGAQPYELFAPGSRELNRRSTCADSQQLVQKQKTRTGNPVAFETETMDFFLQHSLLIFPNPSLIQALHLARTECNP